MFLHAIFKVPYRTLKHSSGLESHYLYRWRHFNFERICYLVSGTHIIVMYVIYVYTMYMYAAAAAAKSLQSCPTLCNPKDRSPPGSPVPGILQARTLDWVAISFSNAWKWKVKVKSLSSVQSLSRVQLLATPWTTAYQAPPSLGFSRQEHWNGLPFPSPVKVKVKVKSESEVAQSCLTLSNPMDLSPPDSSIHGIFQARVLEWGAIAFSYIYVYQNINYDCLNK